MPLTGWIYNGWQVAGEAIPHSDVTLLAPCTPTKIIGAGLNYRSVAEAKVKEPPAEPILFLKPPSAAIGPEAPIVYPSRVGQLAYEAEVAVVMGRRCRRVGPEKALEYVLGYTLANDITAKDLLPASGPWLKGMGFDTFLPLGLAIVTDLDPESLSVEMWLNGDRVHQGNTDGLIFSVPELVSYASQILTLEPGDVLLTGTPAGRWAAGRGQSHRGLQRGHWPPGQYGCC